jgi:hypothetical protein
VEITGRTTIGNLPEEVTKAWANRNGSIILVTVDDMKKWNPLTHPGHVAAALTVEEVYSGAKKLL